MFVSDFKGLENGDKNICFHTFMNCSPDRIFPGIDQESKHINAKRKIGLALSSGGAWGIAHLGFTYALYVSGLYKYVAEISGSSAGGIAAIMLSSGLAPMDAMLRLMRYKARNFISINPLAPGLPGLSTDKNIIKLIEKEIGDKTFEEIEQKSGIKAMVFATSITSGEPVCISDGKISEAASATSSIPGLFKGRIINGEPLIDGDLSNRMPSDALSNGLLKIGVNVQHGVHSRYIHRNSIGYALRLLGLTKDDQVKNNLKSNQGRCDYYVTPKVHDYSHLSLKDAWKIFWAGYESGIEIIPEIKEALELL